MNQGDRVFVTRYSGNYMYLLGDRKYEILDQYDELMDGVVAVIGGVDNIDSEEMPSEVIIMREAGDEFIITQIIGNIHKPERLKLLFRYISTYAKSIGIHKIIVHREESKPEEIKTFLVDEGYEKSNERLEYLLDVSESLVKDKLSVDNLKKIKSLYKLPIECFERLNMTIDKDDKIDDDIDYRNHIDITKDLCIAYVDDNEIKGYMLCQKNDSEMVIRAICIPDKSMDILKAMLVGFREIRHALYPKINLLRVIGYNQAMEVFVESLFKDSVICSVKMADYTKVL